MQGRSVVTMDDMQSGVQAKRRGRRGGSLRSAGSSRIMFQKNPDAAMGIKISKEAAACREGQLLLPWMTCNLACRLKDVVGGATLPRSRSGSAGHPNFNT